MAKPLEQIIYTRLKEYEPLTANLAKYGKLPAVFYQKAPDDNDPGWKRGAQYPRVVVNMTLQANAERKSAGTLTVEVYTDTAGEKEPEDISPQVIAAMKDVILKPEGGSPYAFAWARTDPFELQLSENTARRVIGQDVTFDILEMPPQQTTDPDPVAAINAWLAETFPDAVIVWQTPMQEITVATPEHPVIYVQFIKSDVDYEIFAVSWLYATISIHVICPDAGARLALVMALNYRIAEHDELIMLDGSVMIADRPTVDNRTDYLQNGQISTRARYGVVRSRVRPAPLLNVNLTVNDKEKQKDGTGNRSSQSGGYTGWR